MREVRALAGTIAALPGSSDVMLWGALFLLVQSAEPAPTAAPAAQAKPDIEIDAKVRVRAVEIESEGEARMVLSAAPDAGSEVRVERSRPAGSASYRNLTVELHAEARIADPLEDASSAETTGEPE